MARDPNIEPFDYPLDPDGGVTLRPLEFGADADEVAADREQMLKTVRGSEFGRIAPADEASDVIPLFGKAATALKKALGR